MNGECQKKNRRRRRREKKENEKKTPKRRTLPSSSRHANEASVTGPQPAVFTELLPGFTFSLRTPHRSRRDRLSVEFLVRVEGVGCQLFFFCFGFFFRVCYLVVGGPSGGRRRRS